MNARFDPPAPSPDLQQIYALSASGQDELRGGATLLPSLELELLVRIDGQLKLDQIQAAMPAVPALAFTRAAQCLLQRGLLAQAQPDAFDLRLDQHLQRLSQVQDQDGPRVDAGLASLKRSGYFVGIARAAAAPRRRPDAVGLSALLVEDEPNLARFVQSYLGFDGFQVRLAADRAAVITQLNQPPVPDLILLDVMLPDADGFDILLRLRQHPVLRQVPVIMLTGQASREAVLRGMAAGADGYVTKPFEADSLMRAVRTVLGLPQVAVAIEPWANRDAANKHEQH